VPTFADIVCIALCVAILAAGGFVVHLFTERKARA
jgi:hypothetical protein